ncbi:hypothetical protein IRZ71_20445 [Flavobacterium sp. ANB]|uniref:hypothetical protein n=1 Tax=unclassified Flavobacterium TaxID=196869 RepID=UPI0012B88B11|nr:MULTISPECIES: hypothetical protein [unclassified Flavobacterium]MBF4518732.1 hypothetical protein [Flavobacterium sp. ANB]MTD67737.1 hypothetical protein [Flavobacterium sp. LC2016-13]
MSEIQFQKQKELENAVGELQSFMDITAVTLHHAETAGKSGHILTIILREDSQQIASEMYEWADKVLKKYPSVPYVIINLWDVLHRLKNGCLYYLKWYLSNISLFKNDEFDFKIKKDIPAVSVLLKKAVKKNSGLLAKAESLRRGSQHYEGTNNHSMALYTIHQAVNLLFGIIGGLVMGKSHSNHYTLSHLDTIKDYAPVLKQVFNTDHDKDKEIADLLDRARIEFPYAGKTKIKKERVKEAQNKLYRILKETKKIFQDQLSYCEEKSALFIEPKQNPEILNDEVIDYEKLVSDTVTSYLKTEAVYCFGTLEKTVRHFYLLVLVKENKLNAVHDLADVIKSRTKEQCTATLLIHNISELKSATGDQKFFFLNIIKNGKALFKKESAVLETVNLPVRCITSAKEYLSYRNIVVNYMESWQGDYEWACYAPLKGLMLHTMAEQICLGMIRLFMGYSPNHFSLSYLLEICDHFNPEISSYFPRVTEQDRNLFTILSRSYASLRYSGADTFSELDMNLLQDRYNDFAGFCTGVVQDELRRTEKLISAEP